MSWAYDTYRFETRRHRSVQQIENFSSNCFVNTAQNSILSTYPVHLFGRLTLTATVLDAIRRPNFMWGFMSCAECNYICFGGGNRQIQLFTFYMVGKTKRDHAITKGQTAIGPKRNRKKKIITSNGLFFYPYAILTEHITRANVCENIAW